MDEDVSIVIDIDVLRTALAPSGNSCTSRCLYKGVRSDYLLASYSHISAPYFILPRIDLSASARFRKTSFLTATLKTTQCLEPVLERWVILALVMRDIFIEGLGILGPFGDKHSTAVSIFRYGIVIGHANQSAP